MPSAFVVKLSSLKIFAIKLALFSSMLGYLALDLFLFHGPVWHAMYSSKQPQAESARLAQVYGEKITDKQLQRYAAEQHWLSGQPQDAAVSQGQRAVQLMDLVRGSILRMRARYNDKNLPNVSAAAQEEVQRLASRAPSDEAFDTWLASQGFTRPLFTQKLEAIMKQAALLERTVRPLCEVSDADVEKHYQLLKEQLTAPSHRRVKHIFFATLDKDAEKVRQQAQGVLDRLARGEADFSALAKAHSEDARTAPLGGELGDISDDEHFPLPELPIFGANAIPTGQPTLAQSRWGWHILLAEELVPARQLSLEEARESLRTAIQSAQADLAIQRYFDEAIREGFFKKHLNIHAK